MITKLCLCCKIGRVEAEYSSYEICRVCGWEDDGIQGDDLNYAGGANKLSLNEYRKQFDQKRKENPEYKWADDPNRK